MCKISLGGGGGEEVTSVDSLYKYKKAQRIVPTLLKLYLAHVSPKLCINRTIRKTVFSPKSLPQKWIQIVRCLNTDQITKESEGDMIPSLKIMKN